MGKPTSLKELLASEDPKGLIQTLDFENALKLLEELVDQVERGSLPLDKAILSYEKGVLLIEQLRSVLTSAEKKLQVLQRSGESSKTGKKE